MLAISFLAFASPSLLERVDAEPSLYWLAAWAVAAMLGLLTTLQLGLEWHPAAGLWRRLPRHLLAPGFFVLAVVAVVVVGRWPAIVIGPMRNPDEAQLGAAALTYWHDPVPWRSVDLNTSGPIDAYFLWPTLLFDGHISYPELRLAAIFAHIVGALACYGLLRRFASEGIARLGTLSLIAFVAFNSNWEYVQYSSEQPAFCLLAVAAWLLAESCRPPISGARRIRRLIGAGLCIGCVPLAKLQSVAFGLSLGGIGLLAISFAPGLSRRERFQSLLALAGAALAPAVLFAGWITVYGQWAQVYSAFIKSNFVYVDAHAEDRLKVLAEFYPRFVRDNTTFKPFFLGSMALAVTGLALGGWSRSGLRPALSAAWVLVAVGTWTVLFPGRIFWHYLHFLVLPLAWLGGLSIAAIFGFIEAKVIVPWVNVIRWGVVAVIALFLLGPQGWRHQPDELVGHLAERHRNSVHPVSARLRALARPGETLVVWGWAPHFYIESGLAQGTRDGNTHNQISPGPMRDFYRERMLWDMRKHQPAFVVDAITEGSFIYDKRPYFGPQIFPELAAYLDQYYRLEEDLGGYLIYVRRDREIPRAPAS